MALFYTRTPVTISESEGTVVGDYGIPFNVDDGDLLNFREAFRSNPNIVQRPGEYDYVAINRYPNPVGASGGAAWGVSGAPMTTTYSNAVGFTNNYYPDNLVGTGSCVRCNGAPTAGFWISPINGGGAAVATEALAARGARQVTAGQTYYFRYWIKADVFTGYTARSRAYFWKADGTWIGDQDVTVAANATLVVGQWTLIQGSFVAPPNTGWATFAARFDGAASGTALDFSITGAMDGVGTAPQFVIGDYTNGMWTGARNNSPSIQLDSRLVQPYPGPRGGTGWGQYHPDGGYSPTAAYNDNILPAGVPLTMTVYRSIVTGTTAGNGTLLVSPNGGDSASGITDPVTMNNRGYQQVTPGGKYGVTCWARCASGTQNLGIAAYFRKADGSMVTTVSSPTLVTNATAGVWYLLKTTFTVPAGAEWAMFWVQYIRTSYTPPFTWDTRTTMPITNAGDPIDFFDGSYVPNGKWWGTPLLSASYRNA